MYITRSLLKVVMLWQEWDAYCALQGKKYPSNFFIMRNFNCIQVWFMLQTMFLKFDINKGY